MDQKYRTLQVANKRLLATAKARGKRVRELEAELKVPPCKQTRFEEDEPEIKLLGFFGEETFDNGDIMRIGQFEYTGSTADMWNEGARAVFEYYFEQTPREHATARLARGTAEINLDVDKLETYKQIVDYCQVGDFGRCDEMMGDLVLKYIDSIAPWTEPPPSE